jgi:hypothetical protein
MNRVPGDMRFVTTDESLGIRLHEVNKQRAVDRAVERLRSGLKADWHYLTQDDLTNLRWLLGEIWSIKSRDEWEDLHFGFLGIDHTRRIVGHADRLRRHGVQHMAIIESVCELVRQSELTVGAPSFGVAFAH